MGLLDVLNGMKNGPHGQPDPGQDGSGGMSPLTMAILALLAYKTVKHIGGSQPGANPASVPANPATPPPNPTTANTEGGGLLWRPHEKSTWQRTRWSSRWRCGWQRTERRSQRSAQAVPTKWTNRNNEFMGWHRA